MFKPRTFTEALWHTIDSYARNFNLLVLFSVPFLIVFPLALFLPNFTSLGGIFLRFGSISKDIALFDLGIVAIAFAISLLLFSFGLVAINMVIKTERTLKTLTLYEFQKIEVYTLRLFTVFFIAFIISLGANVYLYELGLHTTLGALISLLASLIVVFAPQAIVIDDQKIKHVASMSLSVLTKRFSYFLAYVLIATILVLVIGQVFISLTPLIGHPETAQLFAVAINALFVVPFLEVLKAQVYLSKYTML